MGMRAMYPKLTLKETHWLLGNKEKLDKAALLRLVESNTENEFDPVQEAFQMLSNDEGFLDMDKIGEIYRWLGFFGTAENLSHENQKIMRQVANRPVEESGGEKGRHRIDLSTFRQMCPFAREMHDVDP